MTLEALRNRHSFLGGHSLCTLCLSDKASRFVARLLFSGLLQIEDSIHSLHGVCYMGVQHTAFSVGIAVQNIHFIHSDCVFILS